MSDVAKALGQQIRKLRNQLHISQEELSFKAGISAAHLGQIERATKNPTIDTVAKIALALNVPITSLFIEDNVSLPQTNSTVDKINTYLSTMTENEQHDFLRIIRIFHSYLPKDK